MNNIGEKFLPIGTVVLLKNAEKRIMIVGYCPNPMSDTKKMYDYSGCLYPEGFVDSTQVALFNHDQIDQVFHLGFSDNEDKTFKEVLNKILKGEPVDDLVFEETPGDNVVAESNQVSDVAPVAPVQVAEVPTFDAAPAQVMPAAPVAPVQVAEVPTFDAAPAQVMPAAPVAPAPVAEVPAFDVAPAPTVVAPVTTVSEIPSFDVAPTPAAVEPAAPKVDFANFVVPQNNGANFFAESPAPAQDVVYPSFDAAPAPAQPREVAVPGVVNPGQNNPVGQFPSVPPSDINGFSLTANPSGLQPQTNVVPDLMAGANTLMPSMDNNTQPDPANDFMNQSKFFGGFNMPASDNGFDAGVNNKTGTFL